MAQRGEVVHGLPGAGKGIVADGADPGHVAVMVQQDRRQPQPGGALEQLFRAMGREDNPPQADALVQRLEGLADLSRERVPHDQLKSLPPRFGQGPLEHQTANGPRGGIFLSPARLVIGLEITEERRRGRLPARPRARGPEERSLPADLVQHPLPLQHLGGAADTQLLGQLDLGRQPAAGKLPVGNRLAQ